MNGSAAADVERTRQPHSAAEWVGERGCSGSAATTLAHGSIIPWFVIMGPAIGPPDMTS